MQNLTAYGYHVVAYPIREALNKKSKYHFVYCTRHTDGIILMNDFIREEDDLIYGEHVETDLPLLRNLNLADKEVFARREELRSVMRNYFERNQIVTRKQIIKNLISDYFGSFHSKDYRAIFKEFIDSGILTTTDMKTKINNRSYNYSAMGQ